jgi:hypothetical protein
VPEIRLAGSGKGESVAPLDQLAGETDRSPAGRIEADKADEEKSDDENEVGKKGKKDK